MVDDWTSNDSEKFGDKDESTKKKNRQYRQNICNRQHRQIIGEIANICNRQKYVCIRPNTLPTTYLTAGEMHPVCEAAGRGDLSLLKRLVSTSSGGLPIIDKTTT
jgi:hypothetical protein